MQVSQACPGVLAQIVWRPSCQYMVVGQMRCGSSMKIIGGQMYGGGMSGGEGTSGGQIIGKAGMKIVLRI